MLTPPSEHASKAQWKLYTLLSTSNRFKLFTIKQEVQVRDLIPLYYNPLHRVDFYIQNLNVVVELQGEQHYRPVAFGGTDSTTTQSRFVRGKNRDVRKRMALEEAGYVFVEFKYDEDISESTLLQKITEASSNGGRSDRH